jgi:hypothetical protein
MGYFAYIINDARRQSAAAYAESGGPPAASEELASIAAGADLKGATAPPRESAEPAARASSPREADEGEGPVGPFRQTTPPEIKTDMEPREYSVAFFSRPATDVPRSDAIVDSVPAFSTTGARPESSGAMIKDEQVHPGTETSGPDPAQAPPDAPAASRSSLGRVAGIDQECSTAVAAVKIGGQTPSPDTSCQIHPKRREAAHDRETEFVPRTPATDPSRQLRNAESGTGDAEPAAVGPRESTTAPATPSPREVPNAGEELRQSTPAPAAAPVTPAARFLHMHEATAADSEPLVHIGRIDIVVLVPEPARKPRSPVAAPSNLANRLYLRRL